MAYHVNLYLLIFLPAVVLCYSLAPQRIRRIVLLLANAAFYLSVSRHLIVFILGTAVFTYYTGLKIEAAGEIPKRKKNWLLLAIIALLAVLALLKYTNFALANLNRLAQFFTGNEPFTIRKILVPLGISFYTLEALGYLLDVYWKRLPAEKNFWKLLLFLSFFPTVMEGPICRYGDVGDPLWECRRATAEEVEMGVLRILWGLFKKMLVADRLNTIVATVYGNPDQYTGYVTAGIAIFYTIQLYMEFSGAMDMVIGSALLFGVKLPENFRQPFFAKSASEFWRRWHISLGVWFKNYIFYPVTLSDLAKKWNKTARKKYGKHIAKVGTSMLALFPVWMCNGLWHGPQWNYIFYGVYYFVLLSLEVILEPAKKSFDGAKIFRKWPVLLGILQTAKTWVIIFAGELFFRADGLGQGFRMFFNIFKPYIQDPNKTSIWRHLGIARSDWAVIALGILVVGAADCIIEWQQRTGKTLRLSGPNWRYAYVFVLFGAVIVLGAYGAGYLAVDLIYAGF